MNELAVVNDFKESSECDLCGKNCEAVIATFRTAFPPNSQICFACFKKLIVVDHKHQQRSQLRITNKKTS